MEEIDIALIKRKSIKGVKALVQRTFILQVSSVATTILLGVYLSRIDYGIFGLASSFVSFLGYFSDIGLAGALIQKKDELTEDDLATTFTIQQILVVSLVVGSLLLSVPIASFYKLDSAGLWLIRSFLVAFLLSSLKSIPSVVLERKLDFNKMVVPQILETLGYNIVVVVLAWKGYGVWSFTWAVLARAIIGLIAIYMVAPWKIKFGLNKNIAERLFKFGIPFQWNAFLALAKDDLFFLFLGKILPIGDLGYIVQAKKLAEMPLRLVMDNVIRVTFPAFSRLQHDMALLRKALEKTTFGMAFIIFPIYVGLIFFMHPFFQIIPKYSKWEPALISFYMLSITSAVAGLSSPLTNALMAVGKIKITLALMVLWTISTWVLAPLLTYLIGFNGFALALLIISSTLFLVVVLTKKVTHFSFWANINKPLLGALAQGGWYTLALPVFGLRGIPWWTLVGFIGVIIYGGILWKTERRKIADLISNFVER